MRVLIANKDVHLRAVVREQLEWVGYLVVTTPDGLSALDLLREAPAPLVALLDDQMPRLTGPQVIAAYQAYGDFADTACPCQPHQFLLFSGNGNSREAAGARRACVPLVPKPCTREALLAAIAQAAARLEGAR